MVAVLIHEITHQVEGYHHEGFASRLTENIAYLYDEGRAAVEELTAFFTADDDENWKELERDYRRYAEQWERRQTDLLVKAGRRAAGQETVGGRGEGGARRGEEERVRPEGTIRAGRTGQAEDVGASAAVEVGRSVGAGPERDVVRVEARPADEAAQSEPDASEYRPVGSARYGIGREGDLQRRPSAPTSRATGVAEAGRVVPRLPAQDLTAREPGAVYNPKVAAAPIFYSQLTKALERHLPAAATAAQIRSILSRGIAKADEIRWTGLAAWIDSQELLDPRRKIPKDEVLAYVRNNAIQVVEVIRQDPPQGWPTPDEFDKQWGRPEKGPVEDVIRHNLFDLEIRGSGENWRVLEYVRPDRQPIFALHHPKKFLEGKDEHGNTIWRIGDDWYWFGSADVAKSHVLSWYENYVYANASPKPKYSSFFPDGGEKYRELLLMWRPDREIYKSPHWSEPNVVAHVRFDERYDVYGRRVLFVDVLGWTTGEQQIKLYDLSNFIGAIRYQKLENGRYYLTAYDPDGGACSGRWPIPEVLG
jgi:hypothetical protein